MPRAGDGEVDSVARRMREGERHGAERPASGSQYQLAVTQRQRLLRLHADRPPVALARIGSIEQLATYSLPPKENEYGFPLSRGRALKANAGSTLASEVMCCSSTGPSSPV